MAELVAASVASGALLHTLQTQMNEFTGGLKSDGESLERQVKYMDDYYQSHKHDILYHRKELQTALKNETTLLKVTNERLKKGNLKNFLKESERKLQQSNQALNDLLTERKQIEIKKENDPPISGRTAITITTLVPTDVNLPQLVPREDRTDNLAKLNVHLTGGLLEDVNESKPHIFRDLYHVPHDTNFIINCLLNLLVHHKKELRNSLLLRLHCAQFEMRKSILLSFVYLLVEQNIFEEIRVRFLPQEPIIEAVKGIFSNINVELGKRNLHCIDDLDRAIQSSCSTEVRAEEIKNVFDVEGWMLPHLAEWRFDADYHVSFRCCKIGENTYMYYKENFEDTWPDAPAFVQTIPDTTTIPRWVRPSLSAAVVDALKKDIPHKYSSKLSPANHQNWKLFLSSLYTYDQVPALPESWPLQDLITGEE